MRESHGYRKDRNDRALVTTAIQGIQGIAARGGLDYLVPPWLDEVRGLSGSRESDVKYTRTIAEFQALLAVAGWRLDSDPADVASIAQAYAGRRLDGRRDVANTTYNQRLGILSSFYRFARTRGGVDIPNPIDRVRRRKVQQYAGAHALDTETVMARLAAIDRATLAGKRDYALISLALMTGRRREELRTFTWGQIERRGQARDELLTTWDTKGGKIMRDTLASGSGTSQALLAWISAFYGESALDLDTLSPDAPVFVTLHRGYRGQALSSRAMADIWARHLGTGKVHTTRHTFATMLEQQGARISEIQARLGHSSIATTGRYVAALTSDQNPYAAALEKALGIA